MGRVLACVGDKHTKRSIQARDTTFTYHRYRRAEHRERQSPDKTQSARVGRGVVRLNTIYRAGEHAENRSRPIVRCACRYGFYIPDRVPGNNS